MTKMALYIHQSVGFGGANQSRDVRKIQFFLNLNEALPRLVKDGFCGPKTIASIRNFQSRFMLTPDARVDPCGRTIMELNKAELSKSETANKQKVRSSYWEGDSSRWSHKKKLDSLNPGFKEKVKEMVEELQHRQFRPKIFFAWRSVEVQLELYRKKRTKVKFSFHNSQKPDGRPYAYAVDVIDRRWAWGAAAQANGFWDALGETAKDNRLHWGGDWISFKDLAHVQFFPNSDLARIRRESGILD
jgi:peptidoglycan hydrolase-like protein with peptidoglycan-binding domain